MDKQYGKDWVERKLAKPEVRLAFDIERASLEFGEQLHSAMKAAQLSRADLAERLGTSRANVTQILRRGSNLTIKTMGELAAAVGYEIHVLLRVRTEKPSPIFRVPLPPWEWISATKSQSGDEDEMMSQPDLLLGCSELPRAFAALETSAQPDSSWRLRHFDEAGVELAP